MSAVSPSEVQTLPLRRIGSSLCLTNLGRYVFDKAPYRNVLSSKPLNDYARKNLLFSQLRSLERALSDADLGAGTKSTVLVGDMAITCAVELFWRLLVGHDVMLTASAVDEVCKTKSLFAAAGFGCCYVCMRCVSKTFKASRIVMCGRYLDAEALSRLRKRA